VLDRLLFGRESLIALKKCTEFSIVVGDVRRQDDVAAAMQGVDAVVHLAAVVGEAACNFDHERSWQTNHDSIPMMIEMAAASGIQRFIFISTCSNYGVSEPNSLIDEDGALNPLSDYAKAKVNAEKILLADNAIPITTILRLGTICGLSPRMRFDLLINEMARDTVCNREIQIYAPAAWRPYLHIEDAAEAIECVLLAGPALINRRVFNVVGENHQKSSLLEMAKRLRPEVKATITDKKPDLRDYRVNGDRFREIIGFESKRRIEQAFREVAAAVAEGRIHDPYWPGHSAVPIAGFPQD
jgi:nucleoside-diphosphate-sugar epimerase